MLCISIMLMTSWNRKMPSMITKHHNHNVTTTKKKAKAIRPFYNNRREKILDVEKSRVIVHNDVIVQISSA